MLKLYDHLDELLELEHKRSLHTTGATQLASDLMEDLGYQDENDLHHALRRAFEICCTMHISIPDNFRKIYRYSDNLVEVDWQVSDLGCYLLLINGNSCNPNVAKAQLHAIITATRHF